MHRVKMHCSACWTLKPSWSSLHCCHLTVSFLNRSTAISPPIMAPRSTRTMAVLDLMSVYPIYIYDSPVRYPGGSVVAIPAGGHPTPKYSLKQFSLISSSSASGASCSLEGMDCRIDVLFLRVCFWADQHPDPIYSVDVAVPPGWSPRMYLGALRVTIGMHHVAISAPKRILGSTYSTLNFVHRMFGFSLPQALSILYGENVFRSVVGGFRSIILP